MKYERKQRRNSTSVRVVSPSKACFTRRYVPVSRGDILFGYPLMASTTGSAICPTVQPLQWRPEVSGLVSRPSCKELADPARFVTYLMASSV